MAYQKTTWNDGDVITAEKINNIESGVEAAVTRSPTALNLRTGSSGRVEGGTITFSDGSSFEITINIEEGA